MIFSTSCEYAIRGLSELASRSPSDSMMLDDVIAGANLPRDFMAKLFQRLVRAGILRSAKGRGGGFALSRPPHEVTLMHVCEAIDGPQIFDRCVVGMERCTDHMPCAQHDLYKPIRQRLKDYLNTTTLADLAASLKSKAAWREMRRDRDTHLVSSGATAVDERSSS